MATYYNIEMIGRLAQDNEIPQGKYGVRNPVFINNSGDIQYNVKSLSTMNGINDEIFTGYTDSIQDLEFVDDEYDTEDHRIEAFTEYYANHHLFVFTHKTDAAGYKKVDSADIVRWPFKIDENSRFVAIPCFCGKSKCDSVGGYFLYKGYEDYDEFLEFIKEGKAIGRVSNFEIKTSFPEFIIWDDGQRICAIGPINNIKISERSILTLDVDPNNLCEIDLDDESDDTIEYIVQTKRNPTLIHITEKKYLDIVNEISKRVSTNPSSIQNAEESVLQKDAPAVDNTVSTANISPVDDARELPTEKTEAAIFEFFRYHSQMNKLYYNPKDITNFHTAIKTGSMVILSGMSGTGKSALVDTYAKALGIKNILTIPVRPSWNDDSDLLGYVDLIHMVYRPSDTGFIDKIVEASNNKDKLYLICLDEMNLARVEHYFSQFLSILEKPVESRELVLYDEQYDGKLYNCSRYPQSISIGDNVKFIGTVNIDESTYHFSDKVLDRANVITLDVLDYAQPDNWKTDKYIKASTPEWSNEDFRSLIKREDTPFYRVRKLLREIHLLLHELNANLGVGPRIVKSVEAYLRNLPELDTDFSLSFEDGLDYQLSQRVFTKIRGPKEQLEEIFDSQGENRLIKLLDEFSDISLFEKSRKIIKQKEKELSAYGYCL